MQTEQKRLLFISKFLFLLSHSGCKSNLEYLMNLIFILSLFDEVLF